MNVCLLEHTGAGVSAAPDRGTAEASPPSPPGGDTAATQPRVQGQVEIQEVGFAFDITT